MWWWVLRLIHFPYGKQKSWYFMTIVLKHWKKKFSLLAKFKGLNKLKVLGNKDKDIIILTAD